MKHELPKWKGHNVGESPTESELRDDFNDLLSYLAERDGTAPEQPKPEWARLLDEAKEYYNSLKLNGIDIFKMVSIKYESACNAMKEEIERQHKVIDDFAKTNNEQFDKLMEAEMRIKELEEMLRQAVEGHIPLYKDIVERKNKEIQRLRDGIEKAIDSITKAWRAYEDPHDLECRVNIIGDNLEDLLKKEGL